MTQMVARAEKALRKTTSKMADSTGYTDIHLAEAKCDIDFPAGRCGGHAPTGVRWTAPKAATVDITGGAWKLRNNAPADLTLWVNDRKIIDRAPITGGSSEPLDFDQLMTLQGKDPKSLRNIAVKPGD
jgi:hypothetical protein